jgi:hypothetical protein
MLSPPESRTLSAELRDAGWVTPLLLADGRTAVAWTDDDDNEKHERIHVAVEGAPEVADAAAPRVTVRGPARHVLARDSELPLTVTCSAACDVRLQAVIAFDAFDALATVSLARAGTRTVVLEPGFASIARLRTGPVKILVRSGAPGAKRAQAHAPASRSRPPPHGRPQRRRPL